MHDHNSIDAIALLKAFEIKDKVVAQSKPLTISRETVIKNERQVERQINRILEIRDIFKESL